jgi:hypothetical protein
MGVARCDVTGAGVYGLRGVGVDDAHDVSGILGSPVGGGVEDEILGRLGCNVVGRPVGKFALYYYDKATRLLRILSLSVIEGVLFYTLVNHTELSVGRLRNWCLLRGRLRTAV